MTKTFQAHFDGKTIIPDHPVDLPRGRRLLIHVDTTAESPVESAAQGTVGNMMEQFKSPVSDEDAELMRRAVNEADRNFEPSPDINLD
jgi:hypothetical protein